MKSGQHKKLAELGFATRAIHAGQSPDPSTGAIMTPVFLTSTYVQSSPGVHAGYEYSRTSNPTRKAFEDCLASLEGGHGGFAFASGCAATTTVLHLMKSGDHVLAGDDMYGGTFRLFDKVIKNWGVEFEYVDFGDPSWSKKIRPTTKMVWLETPTNPTLKIFDIEQVCDVAHKLSKDILVCVDNTFMSPALQNPLHLGADLVVHSTTKFINGHSDVVGGAVITRSAELSERIHFLLNAIGAVASPMDSFLCMRSLKTLDLRMREHSQSAMKVAEFLEAHPKIEKVVYPGLESHPNHSLAKRQMRNFGGMITAFLKSDLGGCRRFLESVDIFSLAESLGGVESLIEHPAIMTHASIPSDARKALGINDQMIRLSVGIENVNDLIDDLKLALERV